MHDDRLTVLLTLKGRPEFTLRWLWHAHKTNFPFKVYIADGEVNERLADLLESKSHFKNVQYQYVRYDDATLKDYFLKCADAAAKVSSKYVMMADNDDFIFVSGVRNCLNYLDSNPDYVCAQGVVSGFGVESMKEEMSKVQGKINRLKFLYSPSYLPRIIDANTSLERIQQQMKQYHITFYTIKRRLALEMITAELVELNFTNLELHELYWAYREASLGKIHATTNDLYYFRQRQTTLRKSQDWVASFINTNYSAEMKLMLLALAKNLPDHTEDSLIETFGERLRAIMRHQYGRRELRLGERVKRKLSRHYDPTGRKEFLREVRNNAKNSEEQLQELCAMENTLKDPDLSSLIIKTLN